MSRSVSFIRSAIRPHGRGLMAPGVALLLVLGAALAGCDRDTAGAGTPAASAPGGATAPARDAGMPPADGPVHGEAGQRSDAVPGDAGSTRPGDAPATDASQPPPGGARAGAVQPGGGATPPASAPPSPAPGSGSSSGTSSSGPLQPQERRFVAAAYESGRFEAEVARIGAARSRAPAVKSLSATLVAERHSATETLRRIAETRDVPLPDRMTSEMQAQIDSLAGLPVAALDDLLVHSVLIPAHQAGVQRYEAAAESARDPELKDFIERTLPVLKEQLQAVQTLPLPPAPR